MLHFSLLTPARIHIFSTFLQLLHNLIARIKMKPDFRVLDLGFQKIFAEFFQKIRQFVWKNSAKNYWRPKNIWLYFYPSNLVV